MAKIKKDRLPSIEMLQGIRDKMNIIATYSNEEKKSLQTLVDHMHEALKYKPKTLLVECTVDEYKEVVKLLDKLRDQDLQNNLLTDDQNKK